MYGARDNNEDLLKFLLSNGADPMMKNNEGKSALDILLDNQKPKLLMINNIISRYNINIISTIKIGENYGY